MKSSLTFTSDGRRRRICDRTAAWLVEVLVWPDLRLKTRCSGAASRVCGSVLCRGVLGLGVVVGFLDGGYGWVVGEGFAGRHVDYQGMVWDGI